MDQIIMLGRVNQKHCQILQTNMTLPVTYAVNDTYKWFNQADIGEPTTVATQRYQNEYIAYRRLEDLKPNNYMSNTFMCMYVLLITYLR